MVFLGDQKLNKIYIKLHLFSWHYDPESLFACMQQYYNYYYINFFKFFIQNSIKMCTGTYQLYHVF